MLSSSFCSVRLRKTTLRTIRFLNYKNSFIASIPFSGRGHASSLQDDPGKQSDVKTQHVVPVKDWTDTEVESWAKTIVGDEGKILFTQKIYGKHLRNITQVELERWGMKAGSAKEIIAALKELEPSQDTTTRNLDSLTLDSVKPGGKTGLKVFHLRALINPKDPSSNQLFIRQFFCRYLKAVRKHEYSIVIGNPGIGKTWFQYYYLVRILNVDKLGLLPPDSYGSTAPPQYVIRQVGSRQIETYDIQAKTVVVRRCSELEIEKFLDSFDRKTTLFFFEPDLTIHEPTSTDIPTMITVSPNTLRYHEFLKQKGAIPLYMPVWTEAELVAVGKKLLPTLSEEEEAKIKKNFQEFGGIFRSVFGTEAVQDAVRSKRKQAIAELDVRSLLAATTIEDMRVSHLIAQFSNIPPTGSKAFQSFEISFLGDVEEELRDKMVALDLNEMIVTLMKNDKSPIISSQFSRFIYEEVVARRPIQGVNWQERDNSSKDYSKFALKLTSSAKFPQFDQMENNILYRPSKENYPLVDMVYMLENKLFAIQVSREKGGKRSIDKSTLIKFLDQLKSKEEDFTYYYCPSPQYADTATVTISYPEEWTIVKEVKDDTTNSMKKVRRPMTEKEIKIEKNRCKKFLLRCKIIKIPEDYGIQFKEPIISKLSGTSPSNPNSE